MEISGANGLAMLAAVRQRMFQKLDADGDGSLSRDEFAKGVAGNAAATSSSSRINDFFTAADTDGDNKLSLDELTSAMTQRSAGATSNAATARIDALFKTIDANGDGKISKGEIEAQVASMKAAAGAVLTSSDPAEFSGLGDATGQNLPSTLMAAMQSYQQSPLMGMFGGLSGSAGITA